MKIRKCILNTKIVHVKTFETKYMHMHMYMHMYMYMHMHMHMYM